METPTICACNYGTSTIDIGSSGLVGGGQWRDALDNDPDDQIKQLLGRFSNQQQTTDTNIMANQTVSRRIVQVFIADPNENVPLDQSVLYRGEQKLTDLTDTELFFEVPIADTLKAHNERRVKWADKDASKKAGKDVFLDPAKIRDLKMIVVTVATF